MVSLKNQLKFSHFDTLTKRYIYDLDNIDTSELKIAIANWSKHFSHSLLLDNNNYTRLKMSYHRYEMLWAVGAYHLLQPKQYKLQALQALLDTNKDWLLGYFSYDLKAETAGISSTKPSHIGFSDLMFFIPQYLFVQKNKKWQLFSKKKLPKKFLLDIIDSSLYTLFL